MSLQRMSRIVLALSLCFGFSTPSAASSGATNAGVMAHHALLKIYSLNLRVAVELLQHERSGPIKGASAQLRVQKNAASVARMSKAYRYYLDALKKAFPKQKALWTSLSTKIQLLRSFALALRKDALAGKKSKASARALQKAKKAVAPSVRPAKIKTLTKKQVKLTLDAIAGLGTGGELLAYFRLRQIISRLKKQKGAKALKPLKGFLASLLPARSAFRKLRRGFPQARWLRAYVYHAALLVRCSFLMGKAHSKKGQARKQLHAKYSRRLKQLSTSLKRANSSFKHVWKLAKGE